MEEITQTSDLDSGLIDEIVCKVKSEGLFDQFRRECLADVDTKPAYQNLQHRVESSVSLFLDEQKWNSQTNKNQLREKLRKLITEKSFFEAGIGRIVDQVVNPKLNSNFVPKIEDVAYKLLGVEKPSMNTNLELEIETDVLLPIYELEQVSPESEKSQSNESKYANPIFESISTRYQIHEESDGKIEDLESPAFEPIEPTSEHKSNLESNEINDDDMDISDDDTDAGDNDRQVNGFTCSQMDRMDEVKSNLSSISGLTSNDSNNSSCSNLKEMSENNVSVGKDDDIKLSKIIPAENHMAPEITIDSAERLPFSENIISNTSDLIIDNMNQDSILSQVSSTSRLSIVTNNNTNTRTGDGEFETSIQQAEVRQESSQNTNQTICPYGISEEAQMQKFNENSSSSTGLVIDTDNKPHNTCNLDKKIFITSFDIKKEEIKFEGTDRKCYDVMNNSKKCTEYLGNYKNIGRKENILKCVETEKILYNQKIDFKKSVDFKCKPAATTMEVSEAKQTEEMNREDHMDQYSSIQCKTDIQRQREKYQLRNECSVNDMEHCYMEESNSKDNFKQNKDRNLSRRCMESEKYSEISSIESDDKYSNTQNASFPTNRRKNSQKERSISKTDDHSSHKSKITSRQRSRSKDSNDGFTQTNIQNASSHNESNIGDQSTSNNQTNNRSSKEAEKVTSHTHTDRSREDTSNELSTMNNTREYHHFKQEGIPNSQPVVIDQILTGNELDLTSFIGENQDDPVLSSIKQSLEIKVKKPKVAANMLEAKRLMKIRKQIELSNQKKLEKATVLAKQYIRTNASNMLDDTQGIELEFVCLENRKGRNVPGPIISSPVTKNIIDSSPTSSQTSILDATLKKTEEKNSTAKKTKIDDANESEVLNFVGFEASEVESADFSFTTFLEKVSRSTKLNELKNYHFSENKKGSNEEISPEPCNRDANMTDPHSSSVGDDRLIKVNIKQDRSLHIGDHISSKSTVEKQRQKTRYSNDDLFKPRPLLGGLTRRRRGFDCNE